MEPNPSPQLRLIIGGREDVPTIGLLQIVREHISALEDVWLDDRRSAAARGRTIRSLPEWISDSQRILERKREDGTVFGGYDPVSVPMRVRTDRLRCKLIVRADGVYVERAVLRYGLR